MAVGGDARRLGSPQSDEMKIFRSPEKVRAGAYNLWASPHLDTSSPTTRSFSHKYRACACVVTCKF
jgi:hypothetical protein